MVMGGHVKVNVLGEAVPSTVARVVRGIIAKLFPVMS